MVASSRKKIGIDRVGHSGTLDPFAEGLLVLLVGEATRLQDFFLHRDKVYEGVIRLGVETDSGDLTGKVIRESPEAFWENEDPETFQKKIESAIREKFTGNILQKPPAHSAIRIDGKRAYALARKGISVEMAAREVVIHRFEILSIEKSQIHFSVTVGSGTYIRSLARDLGEALGIPSHLSALKRTALGAEDFLKPVTLAEALPPEAVSPQGVLPVEDFLEIVTVADFKDPSPEVARLSCGDNRDVRGRLGHRGFSGVRVNGVLSQIYFDEPSGPRLVFNLLSPAHK